MFENHCSIVPLITPMTSALEIDIVSFEALISFHVNQGTDGIILFGTTGEGELLSDEEKFFLLERALLIVKSKIPIFICLGSFSTHHAAHLAKKAKEAGVDGFLCPIPPFIRPSVNGCVLHFEVLSSFDLPIILYHTPRSGMLFSFEELKPLIALEKVIGIKECSNDINLIKTISSHFPYKKVFSGIDLSLLKEIDHGVQGSIGVIANLFPKQWKQMLITYSQNKEEGRAIYETFIPLMQAIYREVNPQGIKCALYKAKMIQNYLRLPLIPVSLGVEVEIEMRMSQFFELLMCQV